MRRSVLAALLLFAVVAASGCRHVDTIEPTYAVFKEPDACGWHVIIDRRGALWKERGCKDDRAYARRVRALRPNELARVEAVMARFRYRGNLTEEEFLDVHAAFDAITTMPKVWCHDEHQLRLRNSDGSLRELTVERCAKYPRGCIRDE